VLVAGRDGEELKIIFKDGHIVYAMGSEKEGRLGYLLQSSGAITTAQLRDCLQIAQARKQSLGKVLAEEGYVTREILGEIIRRQAEKIVFKLFLWENGVFEFSETGPDLKGIMVNRLSVPDLILSASRGIHEMSVLKRLIPTEASVFFKTALDPARAGMTLDPTEKAILACVNGRRNAPQLAVESGYDLLSVHKALHALIAVGLVEGREERPEIAGPEASETKTQDTGPDGDLKEEILQSLDDLPPMPQIVTKANMILADPNSSAKELGGLLEKDQAIATRVLKLANSAYYGLSGMVSSIPHASVVLGYKTLGELITVAGTSGLLGRQLEGYGMTSGALWRHSIAVALAAKLIATRLAPKMANDAFSAGLIHDAGKLILDRYVGERRGVFTQFLTNGDRSFLKAEKWILGFDHAEIASEFCRKWNIPESQTTAIRFHHNPSGAEGNLLAGFIHVADFLARTNGLQAGEQTEGEGLEQGTLAAIGLEEEALAELGADLVEAVEKMSEDVQAA
jgi:HD-like signal output (HDOD) protein